MGKPVPNPGTATLADLPDHLLHPPPITTETGGLPGFRAAYLTPQREWLAAHGLSPGYYEILAERRRRRGLPPLDDI